MGEDNARAGLVFIIPPDYPILERMDLLDQVMDVSEDFHIAAIRLATAGLKRDVMMKRSDRLREFGHAREVSVLIDDHPTLSQEIGLDGVHLTRPDAKTLREARKILGKDAIIGVHAGASRHDGMVLAEIGVDYVAFGPLSDQGLDREIAPVDLFEWWSEMIEIPLIAEGGLGEAELASIKDAVDFVALGDEFFADGDPIEALRRSLAIL